jgi:hypothetical protein
MQLIKWLVNAIAGDPAPSRLLVETVSDRAALAMRCEYYLGLLLSHGWDEDSLREGELEFIAKRRRDIGLKSAQGERVR